jgi:uncharacterized protein YecE (DUF72 family)
MPGSDSTVTNRRILVGTCSWADRTLTHDTDWYPRRSMSAAERLGFYASRFPIAEADSTYYFPPGPGLTASWAERTPDGFTMNVKAYSLLTGHPTKPDSLWPDLQGEVRPEFADKRNVYASHLDAGAVEEAWRRFADALQPLHEAGKLGAVLLQYPPWFTAKRASTTELAAVRRRWPDLPVCVEFRSPTWLAAGKDRDRTLHTLADLRLALVVVDAPVAARLPVVPRATTSDLAVIRFHGRNDDTWSKAGTTAAERFKYLYSAAELRGWIPKIEALAEQASSVHALMNNCYQDYGVRNAADLATLLAA